MIDPKPEDIGRVVIYRKRFVRHFPERGRITSFNDKFVFVRYGRMNTSKATRREDLIWEPSRPTGGLDETKKA